MPEPRTYHLSANTALFCTRVQRRCPDIVVSNRTELGGRR
jgi:hypothetical protein